MTEAVYSRMLYLPLSELTDRQVERFKRECTFRSKFHKPNDPKPPIPVYDETWNGYLGLPHSYGFDHWDGPIRSDCGKPLVSFPHRPEPRDASQAQFMRQMLHNAHEEMASVGIAPAGSGKTVTGLWLSAELGLRTLVLVSTERLAAQWIERAKEHLQLPEDAIGRWQQRSCDVDRPLAVGTLQSVVRHRNYPLSAYRAFGHVIWDEAHRANAQVFSQSLMLFVAAHRTALTATWERSDRLHRVSEAFFGRAHVQSVQENMAARVVPIKYVSDRVVWGNNHQSIVMCLKQDEARNRVLAGHIVDMVRRGRKVLAIGDGIDHIETVIQLCIEAGIPEDNIGQYTGTMIVGGDRFKTPIDHLEWTEREADLVFATYGMMKEGIDIPRLDAGIDLTPRANGTQVLGRIQRHLPGKPTPVWITLVDERSPTLKNYAHKRLAEFRSGGNRVEAIRG